MNERKPMTEQEEKTVTILLAKLGPWLWQLEDDVKDVRSFLESRQKWANWSSLKEDDREKSLSFQIYKIFLEIESGFGFLRDCLMHKQDLPKTASVEDFLAYQRNQWKKFDFPLTELKRFEFFLPHVTVPVQQFENLMPLIKEHLNDNETLTLETMWALLNRCLEGACFIIAKIQGLQMKTEPSKSKWKITEI